MKLVVDTNVVVSGLLWLGNPGRLLEAAALRRVTLYTSPALVAELTEILGSQKLAQRIARSGLTLDELLARYLNVAIVVQPESVPPVILEDPDDDQVLACALAAGADSIISGDGHLLGLKQYHGIPILSPVECVRQISA